MGGVRGVWCGVLAAERDLGRVGVVPGVLVGTAAGSRWAAVTRAADPQRAQQFLRALGDELRRARRRRRFTRQDVLDQLGLDLSVQTLATYELGTRPLNVVRLVELADCLGVSALELLARALHRVSRVEPLASALCVDLVAVIGDQSPELAPLRRWARSRLDSSPDGKATVVQLEPSAVRSLAEICGADSSDLANRLRMLVGPHGDDSP